MSDLLPPLYAPVQRTEAGVAGQPTLPPVLTGLLAFVRQQYEQQIADERKRRTHDWLMHQPWYRDINKQAVFGSGTLAEALAAKEPGLSAFGHGGYDGKLLEGGGGVRYTLPLDKGSSVTFAAGGGGATGAIATPTGHKALGEFFPEAAIAYRRSF